MSDPEKAQPPQSPRRRRQWLGNLAPILLREGSLYLGLIVIFVVGGLSSPIFLTGDNQRDVLRAVSQNGILAVGMTLVIITGGIDLSVGRMLGLASVLSAMLLIDRRATAATWFTLPAAAAAAGVLLALLVRTIFLKERRDPVASLAAAVAFVVGAALIAAWTLPQVSSGLSIFTVLIVVPLSGLMLGGLSGAVIAKCRLQPFIVTLAMMTSVWGGARLIASAGGSGYIHMLYDRQGNVPAGVDWLLVIDSEGLAAALPSWAPDGLISLLRSEHAREFFKLLTVPGLFFLACLAIGAFVLNRLRFGRYLYAIGGNEETARLSGINVDRVKVAVYAISGMLAFLAGVLACAQYSHGVPTLGEMGELEAIAAVVIGGTSLMGGRGRMAGTLVGVLIFGYLTNILQLRGLRTDVQLFVTGIIIVLAVLLQEGFIQRLPQPSRLRVVLALFFAFGAMLFLLRPSEGIGRWLMGPGYWLALGVISAALLFVRLRRQWNWIDPALIYALCALLAFLHVASAVACAVAATAIMLAILLRHRHPSPSQAAVDHTARS